MKSFFNKFTEFFFFGDILNIIWWPPIIIFVNRSIFESYNLFTFIGSTLILMVLFSLVKNNTISQLKKYSHNDK